MFLGWYQHAWREIAAPRHLRAAGRKSGLWPLDRHVMVAEDAVEPMTLELEATTDDPITPHNLRKLRSSSRAVRQGKMDPIKATEARKEPRTLACAERPTREKDSFYESRLAA